LLSGSPDCEKVKCKEYKLFLKYNDRIIDTLTDIDTLLHYLIPERIINTQDLDEIKAKPTLSDRVCQLLKYIEGPLKASSTEGFHTLLDVMSTYGNLSTKKLAATMKGTYVQACCQVFNT